MVRLACVNVWALPLQLLLNRQPEFREAPVVVTPDGRANSPILWANAQARRLGIRTGMGCTAAMALAPGLRSGAVPPEAVAAGVRLLTARLQRFSPHVEPAREQPGVFWVEGRGLGLVAGDPELWARNIHGALAAAGFEATVVAGWERFGCYALARARRGILVLADQQAERSAARRVSLERLGLEPKLLEAWAQLAIFTVADFLALPALGLLQRFGPVAYRLHRLAAHLLDEPLQPAREAEPVRETVLLEYPESDTGRLLHLIRGRFPLLMLALARRGESLKVLHLRLLLEGAAPLDTSVRPAAPTRDTALLLDLVRLRLEALCLTGRRLEAGVAELELLAEGEIRRPEQLSLLTISAPRDLEAGSRALARLRAEFGEDAVVRPVLREGHLPEACFGWERVQQLPRPTPGGQDAASGMRGSAPGMGGSASGMGGSAPGMGGSASSMGGSAPGGPNAAQPGAAQLVRRIFAAPRPLDCSADRANPWELGRGLRELLGYPPAPLSRLHGPYPISGGWWHQEQHREYYFAESRRGELFWLHRDRRKGRWFLQGRVE